MAVAAGDILSSLHGEVRWPGKLVTGFWAALGVWPTDSSCPYSSLPTPRPDFPWGYVC